MGILRFFWLLRSSDCESGVKRNNSRVIALSNIVPPVFASSGFVSLSAMINGFYVFFFF